MAKSKEMGFVCQSCGHSQAKWMGKCPGCHAWNSFVEERLPTVKTRTSSPLGFHSKAQPITQVEKEENPRTNIGILELDRVLGGGLVPGSVALVGGEPGIGKSTLLLTTAFRLAQQGLKVLYVSAEESLSQTRLTAERLGALHDNLYLMSETRLENAIQEIDQIEPKIWILDSVQTLMVDELESAPGSVSQVREITARVVHVAKSKGISTFLVGHVTKEGNIAGPRVLEHMVDTVLYFHAPGAGPYRILRAHKNRFGSTNEIGVFEMRGHGLLEINNPSAFFLAERLKGKPGSMIAACMEGTRPVLMEIQALCVSTLFGNPRRTTQGFDQTRCALLAAVLEKRAGMLFSGHDLFINVAGGMELQEPAADLPVALAMASSLTNKACVDNLVCFGEIGLSGELRAVQMTEQRLKEIAHMGFKKVLMPKSKQEISIPKGLEVLYAGHIEEAISIAFY